MCNHITLLNTGVSFFKQASSYVHQLKARIMDNFLMEFQCTHAPTLNEAIDTLTTNPIFRTLSVFALNAQGHNKVNANCR